MLVPSTEFQTNFGKYLAISDHEEIVITRNGKPVAKLTGIKAKDRLALLDELRGIVPDNSIQLEEAKAERLARQ